MRDRLVTALSMLDRFKNTKWRLPYLAHALTDETFALLNLYAPKEGLVKKTLFLAFPYSTTLIGFLARWWVR